MALPHGVERWLWRVHVLLGSWRVSCPDVPHWLKASPPPARVRGGSLGSPEAHGVGAEAGVGCESPRQKYQASSALCQATGDRNKLIMIWDTATCKRLHIFTGHRDAVSVSWSISHNACRAGQYCPPQNPSLLSPCPSVHRACPFVRARTSCTVAPTTALSRSGMWRRTHTWRPCKTRGRHPADPAAVGRSGSPEGCKAAESSAHRSSLPPSPPGLGTRTSSQGWTA